jgi:cytochrome c peroxidase
MAAMKAERNRACSYRQRRPWRLCLRPVLVSSFAFVLFAGIVSSPVTAGAGVTEFDRQAVKRVASPPLGLPAVPVPDYNPVTAEKVALGRKLLFDRRLSGDGDISCGTCHAPGEGFTQNGMPLPTGHKGRPIPRNSPTLFNVAYMKTQFHDGRRPSLETQVFGPFLSPNEMGNTSLRALLAKIKSLPDYKGRFEAVFNSEPSAATVGQAIATYERTILSANSPFDRWYYGGEKGALSEKAKAGFNLFIGKAQCSVCHLVNKDYALFTDNLFHNLGIGYAKQQGEDSPPADLGRFAVTKQEEDRGAFKTPSLRNIALTGPYMHNGSEPTLEATVRLYNRGGIANKNLSPLIVPLGLTDAEVDELVAFMESLTGDNLAELIADTQSVAAEKPGK